jgi:hypothetical protein
VNLSNLNRLKDEALRDAKVIRQILHAVKADKLIPLELFKQSYADKVKGIFRNFVERISYR